MQLLLGSSIALLAITVVVLDFNMADLCYEKTFRWNSMPKMIQSIRVTGQAFEGSLSSFGIFYYAAHVWVFNDEGTQPFNDQSPRRLHGRLLSTLFTDIRHL